MTNVKLFDNYDVGMYEKTYGEGKIISEIYEDETYHSPADLLPRVHKKVVFKYKNKVVKTFLFRSIFDDETQYAINYWTSHLKENSSKGWQKMIRFFWPKDDGELF